MTTKNETTEEFEARMIAQFNARVNQTKLEVNSDISNVEVPQNQAKEYNGPKGLEPTRYSDWEAKGRCHDF